MKCLKFDLHIEDSISSLLHLYDLFLAKSGLERNEDHIEKLVNYKLEYFKSDILFTWHPLFFNLYIFDRFLKELRVAYQLNDFVKLPLQLWDKISGI